MALNQGLGVLGSIPSSATGLMGDLEQVTSPFCASVSPPVDNVTGIMKSTSFLKSFEIY